MSPEDETDLEKRHAHLAYILDLAALYANLKRRKSAPQQLKTEITNLENHIAQELGEFLNG